MVTANTTYGLISLVTGTVYSNQDNVIFSDDGTVISQFRYPQWKVYPEWYVAYQQKQIQVFSHNR